MDGASTAATTASKSTSHMREILRLIPSGIGLSERSTTASGAIPILRKAATLCCVGFVFNSPDGPIYGTREICK